MENVRYTLHFDVSVSEDELIEYYNQKGFTDYPKKKNGRPNMLRVFNKNHHHMLYKIKYDETRQKYDDLIKEKTKQKEAEMCAVIQTNFQAEICTICNDPLSDVSILKCGHKFCMTCAISHFRVSNTCPLCRAEICKKPKDMTAMSTEMVDQAIEEVLNRHEPEREGLIMRDYIKDKLNFFKKNDVLNVERFINDIFHEVKYCILDYNKSVERWYMS
jgi:hypothetical protein